MKKVLLTSTIVAGIAAMSQTAHADLKLDLQGYFRGYAVYDDNDLPGIVNSGGANNKLSKFSFMRDNEVHFTGQTTLDNGLTVGVHNEIKLGNESNGTGAVAFGKEQTDLYFYPGDEPTMTDETYAYFQGDWGRINLGSEDGAAYLLQVAAPSADSNIDGMRVYIQGFDVATWFDQKAGTFGITIPLGYDNADFRQSERMTYLTPKWNGFQAGVSYAAVPGMQNTFGGTYGQPVNSNGDQFKDVWDAAARWDGDFSGLGISVGGGFVGASGQNPAASANLFGSQSYQAWDGGINLTWQQFSLGGAYKWTNTGVKSAVRGNGDVNTWDVGLAWDNGPWHAGASWYYNHWGPNAYGEFTGVGDTLKIDRETIGGGYTYGPGMSVRGAVALLQSDYIRTPAQPQARQTQVTLGTDINF